MTNEEMRAAIAKIMIKNDTDMYELSAYHTMQTGLDYITLKGENNIEGIDLEEEYVEIPNKYIKMIYDAVRVTFDAVHLYELTKKQVCELCTQIVFGSLYLSDYKNRLGVNPKEVAAYADGYIEVEDEHDSFYDYIQSVEYCE